MTHKRAVTEEDLKKDFVLFLHYIWRWLGLPDPTDRQIEMAQYLQYGPDSKMIQAFRGIGKSWIASAYCLWLLWNNPEREILVVSATGARANAFTLFCMKLITEVDILQHMKPTRNQRISGGYRWSSKNFDVSGATAAHSASVKSVGITGQITGDRATDIIFDDVEVPDNSLTVDAREKLIHKCVVEGESVLIPDIPSSVTYLGTPQTEESLYKVIAAKGYKLMVWPARVPSKEKAEMYNGCLAQSIEDMVWDEDIPTGTATDPRRFDEEYLLAKELKMGRSAFQLQFMLDTTLSDAERYPLKLSDLIVLEASLDTTGPTNVIWGSGRGLQVHDLLDMGLTGDRWYKALMVELVGWVPFDGIVMAIDPSGRGADETTFAVVAILGGRQFLLDIGGFQGGYSTETLELLSKIAKKWQVNNIVAESNFGDGMFTQMLIPVLQRIHEGCGVEEIRHNTQKEARIIDTLEPVMNSHKLVIPIDVIQRDLKLCVQDNSTQFSLFYQLTRLTRERGCLRHDDRVDVLAMAVGYWVDMMSRDSLQAHEDFKTEAVEKALEDHVKNCMKIGTLGHQRVTKRTADLYGVQDGSSGFYGNALDNM